MPEQTEVTFLEYGKKTTAKKGACNLVGQLKTSIKVFVSYYALVDGAWNKVTDSAAAPAWGNYSAALAPFGGTSVAVPVYEDWSGMTMPINGVTNEEKEANDIATAIQLPTVLSNSSEGIYTLDGRQMTKGQLKSGLYIKVINGRAYKTIVK
jgi:hypothetical protein